MGAEAHKLHVVFFPFMAHGHMIPTIDVARLFAAREGVKATIITTPVNVATFTNAIESGKKNGTPINIEVFMFPAKELGLPEEFESLEQVLRPKNIDKFFRAERMLNEQLEQYLEKVRPNCLVSDMFFPWTTESAAKFNIPRIVFHGTCSFSLCTQELIRLHEPYKNVSSDDESFVLPSIPHRFNLTRRQVSEELWKHEGKEFKERFDRVKKSETESYGVIVNSFYELEPDYAEFFRKVLGRKAWNVGPLSLSNRSTKDKAQRGKTASIHEHECLKWLNTKKPDSVVYICFGSTASIIAPQLHEIAMALEASGQGFIWVIKDDENGNNVGWLPAGFEQQMEGKGLIIRDWAPQVLILEHEAIGAFVTHCGWNSTLEGISAGVPMVTWPISADQVYNEILVAQILKTGVPVGNKKLNRKPSIEDIIKQRAIGKALKEIMVGKEAEKRRTRAKHLKEMAQKAVEEDGSSYSELSALINDLRGYHLQEQHQQV